MVSGWPCAPRPASKAGCSLPDSGRVLGRLGGVELLDELDTEAEEVGHLCVQGKKKQGQQGSAAGLGG